MKWGPTFLRKKSFLNVYGLEIEVQNEGQFLTNLHVKVNKFEKKYKDLQWGREFKNYYYYF